MSARTYENANPIYVESDTTTGAALVPSEVRRVQDHAASIDNLHGQIQTQKENIERASEQIEKAEAMLKEARSALWFALCDLDPEWEATVAEQGLMGRDQR